MAYPLVGPGGTGNSRSVQAGSRVDSRNDLHPHSHPGPADGPPRDRSPGAAAVGCSLLLGPLSREEMAVMCSGRSLRCAASSARSRSVGPMSVHTKSFLGWSRCALHCRSCPPVSPRAGGGCSLVLIPGFLFPILDRHVLFHPILRLPTRRLHGRTT